MANARRIVEMTDLPVTVDFEGGYAETAEAVERNAASLAAIGAVGCNFEDQVVGTDKLYSLEEQALRIAALRRAVGPDFFINARTDTFMKVPMGDHDSALVDHALERAHAYAEAGANGFFVPLLADLRFLADLCARSPLPVNFMTFPGCPSNRDVAAAGVARISYGPFPYRDVVAQFEDAARRAIHG